MQTALKVTEQVLYSIATHALYPLPSINKNLLQTFHICL